MSHRSITAQTRENGMQAILPFADATRERIVECLRAHPQGLTADELHGILGGRLNNARSRLTELKSQGLVVVIGKRKSALTGVTIAVWAITPNH